MLRLEFLFAQMRHFLNGKTQWDSRSYIDTMMAVLDLFARGDLKTELLKELERASGNLSRLMEYPDVNHQRLETVLRALEHLSRGLHNVSGQLGQDLRDNEFLTTIRQRSSIPGGTCDFDLPAFHMWLNQPTEKRHEEQMRWMASLDPVRQSIEMLLKLIRNSAEPRPYTAEQGRFQQSLDTSVPYQLIRITIPAHAPYYAEVSGGKHRFTLRFLQAGSGRAIPTEESVEFTLSCCSL